MKNLLYIHDSCPHPNKLGSDLVIYRHLKNAEKNGWKINIVLPASSFPKENQKALPATWNIFAIKNPYGIIKPWMINRLRILVYMYYYSICKKQIENLNTTSIVSYFWGFNFCGFARYVAKKQNKRLIYFYHDRFQHFIPQKALSRLKKLEEKNEETAWKMLTVSNKLIYKLKNKHKYEVLLPIPNGDYYLKKDSIENTWIYSGSVYANQVDFFLKLAVVLRKNGISLILVAELPSYLKEKITSENSNIILKNRFITSEDALIYLNEKASVILTGYPENIDEMPWAKDCFPSKFIEYCFLDTPIVTFSPKNTAFYEWCLSNEFANMYTDYREASLEKLVLYTLTDDFKNNAVTQQKKLISEQLSPEVIQAQFESYLN